MIVYIPFILLFNYQVPSLKDDPEKSYSDFIKTFPILNMVGECHLVDGREFYDIDDKVQVVCKYLQAMVDKEIDIDYVEGNLLL